MEDNDCFYSRSYFKQFREDLESKFGDWMANGLPTWADYRALMSGLLISLYKCPGVRPVSVGETWLWMLAKCVLVVTEADSKEDCGTEQLCGGLEAGIEEGIHAVRLLWQHHSQEE